MNQLAHENTRLSSEIGKLEHTVFCLKETENRLKEITGQQDLNVKNLVKLIDTNKRLLKERQNVVRQDVVADVVRAVLKADKDESGDFDAQEIRRMITYIETLPSVKVNRKRLEKALAKNKSVASIIDIVNDLADDNIPDKKRVFSFNFGDEKLVEVLREKKELATKEREEKKKKRKKKMTSKRGEESTGGDKEKERSDSLKDIEPTKTGSETKDESSKTDGVEASRSSKLKPMKEATDDASDHSDPEILEASTKSVLSGGELESLVGLQSRSEKTKNSDPIEEIKPAAAEPGTKGESSKKDDYNGDHFDSKIGTQLELVVDKPGSNRSMISEHSTSKKSKKKSKKNTDLDDSIRSEPPRQRKKSKSGDSHSEASTKSVLSGGELESLVGLQSRSEKTKNSDPIEEIKPAAAEPGTKGESSKKDDDTGDHSDSKIGTQLELVVDKPGSNRSMISMISEHSTSKKSKKKSKKNTDLDDSIRSEPSRQRKKSKSGDSHSEVSPQKKESSRSLSTSQIKPKSNRHGEGSRSVTTESSEASTGPRSTSKTKSLDMSASRNSAQSSKKSAQSSTASSTSNEKKKGILGLRGKGGPLGFGITDKVKKRIKGDDHDSDSD
jgi:hypothetical protein